jgi:DNA-binding transcriptional LysR family regulator
MQDLNDFYYFAQVVEHGGFSSAARALGMQRSKLSRRIAALEARLGVRLIQRSSRRFSVTEVGRAFHARCVAMLIEAEAAQAVIEEAAAEPRGAVRMSCPAALVTYRIGKLLEEFMRAYPAVEVHLESTSRRVDVIGEGFDLAIRVREPPLEHSDLVMRRLEESQHRLVASPELVASRPALTGPLDLANWPTLDFRPVQGDHAWALTHVEGMTAQVRHRPRLVTDDLQMLHAAALGGLGAALLPYMVTAWDLAEGRLVDLLPQWRPRSWVVHAVFPSRRGLLPSVRALVEFLVEGCARAAASTA